MKLNQTNAVRAEVLSRQMEGAWRTSVTCAGEQQTGLRTGGGLDGTQVTGNRLVFLGQGMDANFC